MAAQLGWSVFVSVKTFKSAGNDSCESIFKSRRLYVYLLKARLPSHTLSGILEEGKFQSALNARNEWEASRAASNFS